MIKFFEKPECIEVQVPQFMLAIFMEQFEHAVRPRRSSGVLQIAPGEITRLRTWIQEVDDSGLFDRMKTGFAKNELECLRRRLHQVRTEKAEYEEATAELLAIIEARKDLAKTLSDEREAFETLRQKRASVEAQKKEHNETVEKIVDEIIDMSAITAAHQRLKSLYASYKRKGYLLSTEKEKFRETQSEMQEQVSALESAGWSSKGLDALVDINDNRFDLGNPSRVTTDDILNLVRASPKGDEDRVA